MVILHVTSRPELTTVTLAESLAGLDKLTSLCHGSSTLNSVCITPPRSLYKMLSARPPPVTSYSTVSVSPEGFDVVGKPGIGGKVNEGIGNDGNDGMAVGTTGLVVVG